MEFLPEMSTGGGHLKQKGSKLAYNLCVFFFFSALIISNFRENKRGWKTQRRGKHTIKPLPKNGFGPPPPMIRFFALLFPQRKPAQTRQIPLSEASKTGFGGGTLWYVFHPQKSHDTFCPPISRCPIIKDSLTPHDGQCLPPKSKVSPQPCVWYRTL